MTRTELMIRVRRGLIIAAVSLLVLGCLLYIGDYARLRYKIGKNNGLGSVTVQSDYAVKQKSGKLEYYFDQPQVQQCSHTLFPQMGYTPCWYLQRKANKETKI
jgi:hypothetical protein